MITGNAVVTRKKVEKKRGRPSKYTVTSGTDMMSDDNLMYVPGVKQVSYPFH